MTLGRGQLIFLIATALAGTPAVAAEIAATDGRVALTYDEASWTGALDNAGLPELACKADSCGGSTAGCGTVLVVYQGEPLSRDSFENGFRENLGKSVVDSANANGGTGAELVSPPTVTTLGSNAGITLSIRVAFEDQPTRVDHFWLQSGADLVGFTCLVAEDSYETAAPAFQQIFATAAVSAGETSQ